MAISGFVNAQVYIGQKGTTKLKGEAPQETVIAESSSLVGKLNLTSKKFNFKQALNTILFSRGDLQTKHAQEEYFEVEKFPNATFSGEIINDTDLSEDGTFHVTVSGKFSIHGVEKEMKMPAVITVQNGTAHITSKFTVFLSDFNIKIPRLMTAKVSPEFTVDISMKATKI